MGKLNVIEIKKKLDTTGLTLFAFAKRYDFNPETLRQWFNGSRNPKLDSVEKLAKIFRCKVEDISEYKTPINQDVFNADDYADALVDDHYHNQENWGADVAGLDKEIESIWEKIHTQLDEIHNVLKKNNVRHDIQYLEEELLKPLRKRIDERTRRIDEAFSKQYEGINETAQILSGDLGEERKTLLEYLYRKSNNLKRYELLAEIEREKTQETPVKYSISRVPQGLKAAEKRNKYKDKSK